MEECWLYLVAEGALKHVQLVFRGIDKACVNPIAARCRQKRLFEVFLLHLTAALTDRDEEYNQYEQQYRARHLIPREDHGLTRPHRIHSIPKGVLPGPADSDTHGVVEALYRI